MSFLRAALQETANYPDHPETLSTFRKYLCQRWIDEALEASGVATLRKRRLPAEQVVWLVLGMALMRDRPISEVVAKLDLALPGKDGSAVVAPSSVAQARRRTGAEPLEHLFRRTGETWAHEYRCHAQTLKQARPATPQGGGRCGRDRRGWFALRILGAGLETWVALG